MRYGSKDYISYALSFWVLNLVLFYLTGRWLFIYFLLTTVILIFIPMTGVPLLGMWKKITLWVGKINGLILLSLIFFLLLTPLAWIRKLFSNKESTNKTSADTSYFNDLEKSYTLEDIKNMW